MDGHFSTIVRVATNWVHVVLNFIGPSNGQGFRVFHDGVEVIGNINASQFIPQNSTISSSKFFIGKLYYNMDQDYSSVQVDELFLHNQALTEAEITSLSQNIQNL